jgi:uncharacterized repeat protein (TIGR01451 family)
VSRKAQFHPQAFGTGTLQLIFFRCLAFMILALLAWPLAPNQGRAQTAEPMQAGEAFLTRFSGTKLEVDGSERRTVIDLDGTVGSIIDLRSPRAAPQGQHWPNVTQRAAVTARQVGQVFGIAIDDASPPNIYLAATAAFGLHRRSDNSDWLAGMWGAGGGPGTVYRLNAQNGYVPEVFAEIKIGGRANSGVALGNIAFDPWNRQLYVSDLETGMIHRLSVSDGADLGHYDHGIDGRTAFTDAVTGDTNSLPFVAFNPKGLARTDDCPAGEFATHPQCWNYADFRRRVWGLAVRRDPASGTVRLFYALWSSQGFSNPAFAAADRDDTRNSVWSVRIDEEGAFDVSDVRREFFIPQFFVEEADIARAGASHPVADIAFPKTVEQSVMLLAERGGARNLGLDARTPFAYPHEARVLRYVLAVEGVWQPAGRYDVGFYDRERLGQPYLRANAAGGVDFGFGYSEEGKIDQSVPSEFVWMTGDALCSAEAPCFDIASGQRSEHADVHGIQGLPIDKIDAVAPAEALKPYPAQDEPYPPQGPGNAFMIDADGEIARNDATKIGGIKFYQTYPQVALEIALPGTGIAGPRLADAPTEPIWTLPPDEPPPPWWSGLPIAGPDGPPAPPEGPPPGADWTDLLIQKKSALAECSPGGDCSFIVAVKNLGTKPHTQPITVRDFMLPAGWTLVGVGPAGTKWNCQPAGGSEVKCTHPDPNLQPGEVGQLLLDYKVPTDQSPGTVQNCSNLVIAPGMRDDVASNNIHCTEITIKQAVSPWQIVGVVQLKRDLVLEKSAPHDARADAPGAAALHVCEPGQPCEFMITITNKGGVPFEGHLGVIDTIPAGWSFVSTSPGWFCVLQVGGPLIACRKQSVTLNANQSEMLNIKLRPGPDPQPAQVQNCAAIDWTGNELDEEAGNDKDCTPVNLMPGKPDLQIVKKGPGTCERGGECVYTIFVKNVGTAPYSGKLAIEERNFDAFKLASYSSSGAWSCAQDGRFVRCDSPEVMLAPGQSQSLQLRFELPQDLPVVLDAITDCAKLTAGAETKESCVDTRLRPLWDLSVRKTGPPTCWPDSVGNCRYEIEIRNEGSAPYVGPLSVLETNADLPGVKLNGYRPANWNCQDLGAGKIRCDHPEVTLGPNQSLSPKLQLDVWLPHTIPEKVEVASDCARVLYKGGQPDSDPSNDEDCHQTPLRRGQLHVTGHHCHLIAGCYNATVIPRLDLNGDGTVECIGPDCTDYEFTITNPTAGLYDRPLSLRVTLPVGARLIRAHGNKSAPACQASAWSCSTQGNQLLCRPSSCLLGPDQETSVKLDVKLLPPDFPPIPPTGLTRTVCGVLEWQEREAGAIDIEQRGSRRTEEACVTTRILARPAALGDLQVSTAPQGRCAVGETCSVVNTIANVGGRSFATPTNFQLQGRLSPPVSIAGLRGERAGWSCRITGTGSYTCVRAPSALAAGGSERVRFDLVIPRTFRDTQLTHSVQFVWPGAGDTNLANDRAQFTIPVAAPGVPPVQAVPPPAPLPPKPVLPKAAPPQVVCTGGSIVRGICICPSGMTREQTGPNAFRCVAPAKKPQPVQPMPVLPKAAPPQVVCTGGSVVRGICICPSGMTREQTGPNAFRCVAPAKKPQPVQPMPVLPKAAPPQIVCTGGSVVRGICICPSGTAREQTGPNAFRCTPLKFQMIPGQIVCPPKTKLMNGKCVPIIQ